MRDDLKAAWRTLRHTPGFTIAAVVTIALTIGANTAIMSIADAVLFRPLPYADPDRVYVLLTEDRATGRRGTSIARDALQLLDDHHRGLSAAARFESRPAITVMGEEGAAAVPAAAVSANYFDVLGVRAARGRTFREDDAAIAAPALLSHAAWEQRFGGRAEIVGQSLTLLNATIDVIGVLPRDFIFPTVGASKPEIITLLPASAKGGIFYPLVRLERDVSREQAQAEIDGLLMATTLPRNSTLVLDDVRSVLYPAGQPIMRFLLAAALLVLLAGCSNLAIMVLARGRRHEREIAVRAALGAGTLRLVRPLVFEGLIIGAAGAVVAVLTVSVMFDALLPHVPPAAYRAALVGVDARVAAFALLLGVIAGALVPALAAHRMLHADLQSLLQRGAFGGQRHRFLGAPLVGLQVAVAIVLVFGTVVTSRALVATLAVDLGFSPQHVATLDVVLPGEPLTRQSFYMSAIETLGQRGDVVAVGAASTLPLGGALADDVVLDVDTQKAVAGVVHTLPGYFAAAGMRVRSGRVLSAADVTSAEDVAVISESAARVLFPARDPRGGSFAASGRRFTVVGVVGDVRSHLSRAMLPPVYVVPREATRVMVLVVRTRARQEVTLAEIKRSVSAMAPGSPVSAAWWADTINGLTEYRNPRFQTIVFGTFSLLALVLTTLGIVAVVTFLVRARTREMGVRMALGGSPASLVWLVLKQSTMPVVGGVVLGAITTPWLVKLAEAQLFRVEARDPVTFAIAAMTVLVATVVAASLPARYAARVDPAVTLRSDG